MLSGIQVGSPGLLSSGCLRTEIVLSVEREWPAPCSRDPLACPPLSPCAAELGDAEELGAQKLLTGGPCLELTRAGLFSMVCWWVVWLLSSITCRYLSQMAEESLAPMLWGADRALHTPSCEDLATAAPASLCALGQRFEAGTDTPCGRQGMASMRSSLSLKCYSVLPLCRRLCHLADCSSCC